MINKPAQVTEAHRKLVYELMQMDDRLSAFAHRKAAQLIADSEAMAVAEQNAESYAQFPVRMTREAYLADAKTRDDLRAEVERLSPENKALRQSLRECGQERLEESLRAENAETEIAVIKRGHGELGRYEQLRLKNAELSKELAKERANSNRYKYIAWKSDTSPIMPYRLSDNTLLHGIYADEAIDQAMEEESK